jgi:hypothetical protein
MRKVALTAGLCVLAIALQTRAAHADELDSMSGQRLVETLHHVGVAVDHGLATLHVLRTFESEGNGVNRMRLSIRTPASAVATGLGLEASEGWIDGAFLESWEAEEIHAWMASGEGQGPAGPSALLWGTYSGDELILDAFPLLPGSRLSIRYTLLAPMQYRDGRYYLDYPAPADLESFAPPLFTFPGDDPQSIYSVDGLDVAPGRTVAATSEPDTCDAHYEDDFWKKWEGGFSYCPGPGEILVSAPAPTTGTLDVLYGVFPLSGDRFLVSIDVDAAARLRPLPEKASVVFVVDASLSFGPENLAAALELAKAYTAHLPDAFCEVVAFRRTATRLLGGFVPAPELGGRLEALLTSSLEPANGSNLEAGLALASSLLAERTGPSRLVVITDTLVRRRFHEGLGHEALSDLPPHAVLHVVELHHGGPGVSTYRDDAHALAQLALQHGGILVSVHGGSTRDDYVDAATQLVRPTRIDDLSIRFGGTGPDAIQVPPELPEGRGFDLMFISEGAPLQLLIEGRIWASPFRTTIEADPVYSARFVPALLFGTDLRYEPDADEIVSAAAAGGAVSAFTAYLASPLDAGPSPESFAFPSSPFGSDRALGTDSENALSACGFFPSFDPSEWQNALVQLAGQAVEPCLATSQDPYTARIEAGGPEIVDVEVTGAEELAHCIEEAIWSIHLPESFDVSALYPPLSIEVTIEHP